YTPGTLAGSETSTAPSEETAPASVRNIVRRPKKRPRTEAGTRSLIHAIHALLPMTARTAVTATSVMKSRRRVASPRERKGKATSGRYTRRDAPMAATASGLRPATCGRPAGGRVRAVEAEGREAPREVR